MSFNEYNAVIYIVDDEEAVRDSLRIMIESSGWFVRDFASAEGFLNHYNPNQLGCLILDLRIPAMDGFELQEELAKRNISIPIIFISGNANIHDSSKAFRAGAVDFLEKPFDYETLIERIAEAIRNESRSRTRSEDKHKMQECWDNLTPREKEILRLIVKSHTNKEIARILNISYRTVDAHRASIMRKMYANNTATLVANVVNFDLQSQLEV